MTDQIPAGPKGISDNKVVRLVPSFEQGASPKSVPIKKLADFGMDESFSLAALGQEGQRLEFCEAGRFRSCGQQYVLIGQLGNMEKPRDIVEISKLDKRDEGFLFVAEIKPIEGVLGFSWNRQDHDFRQFLNGLKLDLNALFGQNFAAEKAPVYAIRGH